MKFIAIVTEVPSGPVTATSGVDITAAGVGEVMTVYARIPGGQTSAANDSYTDTLTVTVSY